MQKTRINNAIVALIAFVLMLTIASSLFTAVSFAAEDIHGNRMEVPVPAWKKEGPSPWFGTSDGMPRYNASCGSYNPTSTAPNTSHLLWIRQVAMGGVATTAPDYGYNFPQGCWFADPYNEIVAIGGYVFYGTSDPFRVYSILTCLDERTGEVVWSKRLIDPFTRQPIALSFLWPTMDIRCPVGLLNIPGYPVIDVYFGNTMYAVSTLDGEIVGTYTYPQPVKTYYYSSKFAAMGYTEGVVYLCSADGYAYCYSFSSIPGVPSVKIWGPTYVATGAGAGLTTVYDDILTGASLQLGIVVGIDAITGEVLWRNPIVGQSEMHTAGYGKYYVGGGDGKFYAFDLKTGKLAWRNENTTASYWSEFSNCVGDGVVVATNADGRIYAFDAFTGELLWTFFTGPCPYEPYKTWYGTWPFHQAAIGADGKVYATTGDDISTQDVPGQYLYCHDIHMGELLWKYPTCTMGHTDQGAIADGLLFYPDTYTNQLHCFGKGPTAVEVSVTQSQIVKGSYTGITGRVTDQSPAQPGTPCVSKESMDAWMAYLHAGMPSPDKKTGVPVTLYAKSSDGTTIEIGTVTTDGDTGIFSYMWTPPDEDLYTITAVFAGDESYWDSWASTELAVGPAAAASLSSSGLTTTTMIIGTIAVIATCIAITGRTYRNRREETEK